MNVQTNKFNSIDTLHLTPPFSGVHFPPFSMCQWLPMVNNGGNKQEKSSAASSSLSESFPFFVSPRLSHRLQVQVQDHVTFTANRATVSACPVVAFFHLNSLFHFFWPYVSLDSLAFVSTMCRLLRPFSPAANGHLCSCIESWFLTRHTCGHTNKVSRSYRHFFHSTRLASIFLSFRRANSFGQSKNPTGSFLPPFD